MTEQRLPSNVEAERTLLGAAIIDPDLLPSISGAVKPDHFYVLGDNRLRSSDSREFGQVAREYLRGCVNLRVWPPGRAGLID